MIVRRMGDSRKASEFLKVEDALMISFLNVGVHAVIEIQRPIEGGVVGPDHGAQVMHEIAGGEYQHALVSQWPKQLCQLVMKCRIVLTS